jgi:hypothetical protein
MSTDDKQKKIPVASRTAQACSQADPLVQTSPKDPPASQATRYQLAQLRADTVNQINAQLDLLTAYFSHSLQYQGKALHPARSHATDHWIESANQWESAVPEALRVRLPPTPSDIRPMQAFHFRAVRVEAMLEADARGALFTAGPCATAPSSTSTSTSAYEPSASELDEINLIAFSSQLALMYKWTEMFDAMLYELRTEFPLFEEALEEYLLFPPLPAL